MTFMCQDAMVNKSRKASPRSPPRRSRSDVNAAMEATEGWID
jgi:hypothetical protein